MAGVARIQQIVQDLTKLARGGAPAEPREAGSCPLPTVIEESMRLASVRLSGVLRAENRPQGGVRFTVELLPG